MSNASCKYIIIAKKAVWVDMWCWGLFVYHTATAAMSSWKVMIEENAVCGPFIENITLNSAYFEVNPLAPGRCGSNFYSVIIKHMLRIKFISPSEISPRLMPHIWASYLGHQFLKLNWKFISKKYDLNFQGANESEVSLDIFYQGTQ